MIYSPKYIEKLDREVQTMKFELNLAEDCLDLYRKESAKLNGMGEVSKIHIELILYLERQIKTLKERLKNRKDAKY